MNADAWIAVIGSVVIGLVVRLSNVLVEGLSRIMGVKPPEPIPTPQETVERKLGGAP